MHPLPEALSHKLQNHARGPHPSQTPSESPMTCVSTLPQRDRDPNHQAQVQNSLHLRREPDENGVFSKENTHISKRSLSFENFQCLLFPHTENTQLICVIFRQISRTQIQTLLVSFLSAFHLARDCTSHITDPEDKKRMTCCLGALYIRGLRRYYLMGCHWSV